MNTNLQLQRISNQCTRMICTRYARSIPIYPLVEYPKSGGTWLCRMMAGCMELPFAQYSRLPVAMPSVVHSHWLYHRKLKNVTYLMRDGRDVIVSFYFHAVRKGENPNESNPGRSIEKMKNLLGQDADLQDIRTHLPRFMDHMFKNPRGCRQNWADHLRSWTNKSDVAYVKYEDLRTDCSTAMNQLLQDLGSPAPEDRVREVIDRYSMQKMTGRKPGQEDSKSFIRKGIIGDWKNHFTQESAEMFDHLAGDMLVEVGYESDRSWVNEVD